MKKISACIILILIIIMFCFSSCEDEDNEISIVRGDGCSLDYDYNNEELYLLTEEQYYADTACPCNEMCEDTGDDLLYAGASKIIINPSFENNVYIAGYGLRLAEGIAMDIYARTLVLEYNQIKIAIVSLDLVGLFYNEIVDVKLALLEDDFDYVLISSTHSHDGPDTMGIWSANTQAGVDPDYMASLKDWIIEAVRDADANKELADFRYAQTELTDLTNDSRDPQVLDERLDVIQFVKEGTLENIGILVRWGNHPEAITAAELTISPDFPGYTCNYIEDAIGGTAVYVSGCVGGLMTPLGISVPDGEGGYISTNNHDKAEALGNIVAQEALSIIEGESVQEEESLAFRAQTYYPPLHGVLLMAAGLMGLIDRQSYLYGEPAGVDGDTLRSESVVIRIGNAALASVPGELFPEIAFGGIVNSNKDFPDAEPEPALYIPLAERFDFYTFIGLANDELGYIIPKCQYDSDDYEETVCVGQETAGAVSTVIYSIMEDMP